MSGVNVGTLWVPYSPPQKPDVGWLLDLLTRRLDFSYAWTSRQYDRSEYTEKAQADLTNKIENVWPVEHLEMLKSIREHLADPPVIGKYNVKYAAIIPDSPIFIDFQDDVLVWGWDPMTDKMAWIAEDCQGVFEGMHDDDKGHPCIEFIVLSWSAIEV